MKRVIKTTYILWLIIGILSMLQIFNSNIFAKAETAKKYENFKYTVDATTNEATITGYTVTDDEKILIIPNAVYETDSDGNIIEYDVTSIGTRAFYGKEGMVNVVISDGIKSIGKFAFMNCQSIEYITLPSDIEEIQQSAFKGCTSLKTAEIPETVTSLAGSVFANCESLKEVILHDNVTSIGRYMFSGCTSLENIVIPETVTKIEKNAFENCSSLTEINIPSNVTSIEDYAFAGCEKISEIEFPDALTEIGVSAFEGCKSISIAIIPSAVTSIGEKSFSGCGIFIDDFDNSLIYDFKIIGEKDSVVEEMADNEDITFMDYEEYAAYLNDIKKKEEEIKDNEENPVELPTIIKGDLNDDDKVDSTDAVIILKSYASVIAGGVQTLDSNYADVNGDGDINSVDAVWVLKYYATSLVLGNMGTIEDFIAE